MRLSHRIELQDREKACATLGFCPRVIVNEKPPNLEKTTSSVLSILLIIYGVNCKHY